MVKHKQLAFLLAASAMLLTCESVKAQQWQWRPDVCGGYSDAWSANCRRDSNGNMIDGRTGKTYDSRGNLIPPNSQSVNSVVDSLYRQASDARWAGKYTTEFQLCTKIISLNPQEAQAYFNRGYIKRTHLNDRAGAIADFQVAFKLFRQQRNQYMTRASMEHLQQLSER